VPERPSLESGTEDRWAADRTTSMLKVFVVDDFTVVAEALRTRLSAEPDLEVVGTATSVAAAEAAIERLAPDVVIVDVVLGDGDGLELAARLRQRRPELRVVVVTCHDDVDTAARAVRAGASALVPKDGAVADLTTAIRGALREESYLPPRLLTGVLNALQHEASAQSKDAELIARLTPRERDVLSCMVMGLDRAGVARELVLSVDTVRTHAQSMFLKLNVHSRLEAVSAALRAGLPPRRIV
jgi:DNA-binding NarL/FixJ family response regulator